MKTGFLSLKGDFCCLCALRKKTSSFKTSIFEFPVLEFFKGNERCEYSHIGLADFFFRKS